MVRGENQDFFGKFPERNDDLSYPGGQLFVIADGMGGHRAGREASELAVNILGFYFYSVPTDSILERIGRAFRGANDHIYNYGVNNPANAGMGTTCTALVLTQDQAYIGHVGDSRLYKIKGRQISQLTQDHSTVAEMVRRKIISQEEAKLHPERSTLYRAMGVKPDIEFDFNDDISLKDDDIFLMCTDGLYNRVTDAEIRDAAASQPPREACQKLISLANERGGEDNITLQIIRVHNSDARTTKAMGNSE